MYDYSAIPWTCNIRQTTACLDLFCMCMALRADWSMPVAGAGERQNRHSAVGVRPRQTRVCVSPTQRRLLRLIQ